MKPNSGQNGTKQSKRERALEKLRRRLPGIDGLVSFFQSAGVAAELMPDGCLRVNGSETRPLLQILPPAGTFDWSEVIDEMTIRYASDKFIQVLSDNGRFGQSMRAFLRRSDMGFVIMRGDIRLGLIRATHAYVPGRNAIVANFLSPGPHWSAVANLIHDAEPALIAEHDRGHMVTTASGVACGGTRLSAQPTVRHIRQLPDYVPAELRAACVEASRRLRLERQVAYDRPVVLICSIGELTLLPVIERDSGFCLPFQFAFGPGTIGARLLLADSDPLPLEIGEDVALADAVVGWANALIGFAAVTCIQFEAPAMRTLRGHRDSPAISAPSVPAPRTARPMPSRHPWPSHLVPIGRWASHSGSLVAGHRRRLTGGRTASDDAHQRARRVGITLKPDETWVRPHTRGIPDSLEMRFQWHRPDELARYMPTPGAVSDVAT